MEMEIDIPMHITTDMGQLYVGDYSAKLTIEWDETMAGMDWYVSAVEVLGCYADQKDKWHKLPADHDVARNLRLRAYGEWHDDISRKWDEHTQDMPRRRSKFRIYAGGKK